MIMYDSLDSAPTRLTRILGWWVVLLSYILCIVVAFADVVFPSVTVAPYDDTRVGVTSAITGMLGLLGAIAVFAHRWRVEWVPASALTFLLLARATPLWANLDDNPTRLAAAAMMTLGALNLAKRALDLLVFSEKTRLAAHLREDHAS